MSITVGGKRYQGASGNLALKRLAAEKAKAKAEAQTQAEATITYNPHSGEVSEPVATANPNLNYTPATKNYSEERIAVATAANQPRQGEAYTSVNTSTNPRPTSPTTSGNAQASYEQQTSKGTRTPTPLQMQPENRATNPEAVSLYLTEQAAIAERKRQEAEARGNAAAAVAAGTQAFAIGGARGVWNLKNIAQHPIKTAEGIWGVARHPQQAADQFGQQLRTSPSTTAGEIIVPALFIGGITSKAASLAAEGSATATRTASLTGEVELGGEITADTTITHMRVNIGKKAYRAEAITEGITKPDFEGTRIRSEQSSLEIQQLNKAGKPTKSGTGAARAETQLSAPDEAGIIRTRSSFAQTTELGGKAVLTTGRGAGIIVQETDEVISGLATQYNKPLRIKQGTKPFYQDNPIPSSREGFTVAKSKTILEAPTTTEARALAVEKAFDLNPPRVQSYVNRDVFSATGYYRNITIRPPRSSEGFYAAYSPDTIYVRKSVLNSRSADDIIAHETGHAIADKNNILTHYGGDSAAMAKLSDFWKGDAQGLSRYLKKLQLESELKALQKAGLVEHNNWFELYPQESIPDEVFAETFKARSINPELFKKLAPRMEERFGKLDVTYTAELSSEGPEVMTKYSTTGTEGIAGKELDKLRAQVNDVGYKLTKTEAGAYEIIPEPRSFGERLIFPNGRRVASGNQLLQLRAASAPGFDIELFAARAAEQLYIEEIAPTYYKGGFGVGAVTPQTEVTLQQESKPATMTGAATQSAAPQKQETPRGLTAGSIGIIEVTRREQITQPERLTVPGSGFRSASKFTYKSELIPVVKATQYAGQEQNQQPASKPAEIQKQVTALKFLPAQQTTTETITETIITPQLTPFLAPPPPTAIPEPQVFNQGYAVQVRRRGKFQTVGRVSLPKAEALRIGAKEARNTSAASFRIIPRGRVLSTPTRASAALPDFYKSKREPGVFIQKREKRISTAGELREITLKGIQANKQGRFRIEL